MPRFIYAFVLALIGLMTNQPAVATTDWTFLAIDPRTQTSLWLDESSVHESGKLIDAVYSVTYAKDRPITEQPPEKFRSIRAASRFNCDNGTVAYVHGLYYSEEFTNGNVVFDDAEEQMLTEGLNFDLVAPDSIGEYLLIRLCKLEP